MSKKIAASFKYIFLSVISFISVFPFIWMLLGTTNKSIDITTGTLKLGNQLIINLRHLFESDLNFARSLLNSAFIALLTTIFALLISSMAGYGFEIYRSKAKDRIFNLLLLSRSEEHTSELQSPKDLV